MNDAELDKWKWERMAESRFHLHQKDGSPLAVIIFDRSRGVWYLRLLKRYRSFPLEAMFVDQAKKLATDFLGEEDLTNAKWQERDKTSHSLCNQEGELLAILDFDVEAQKWVAKILRREYETLLGEEADLDEPERVQKLTEDLIKAEQACHYKYVINKFKKGIEVQ